MIVVLVTVLLLALAATAAGRAAAVPPLSRAERIDQALAVYHSPLAGRGRVMVAAGRAFDVSPELIAAISGVESTFAREACGHNAWGIASCARSYRSFDEAIWHVARLLRRSYLDRGLTSLDRIGRVWCPPCGPKWPRDVSWLMRHVFHTPDTRLEAR